MRASVRHTEAFSGLVQHDATIHQVKPGLSSWLSECPSFRRMRVCPVEGGVSISRHTAIRGLEHPRVRIHIFEIRNLVPLPTRSRLGTSRVTCLPVSSCVMPAILSSYALEGIEAVPVDVVVDGDIGSGSSIPRPVVAGSRSDAHHPFQKAAQHVRLESSLQRDSSPEKSTHYHHSTHNS